MGLGSVGFLCLKSMRGDEWIWGKYPSLESLLLNILDAFPCLLWCIRPPKSRKTRDRAKEAKLRRQEKSTKRHRHAEEKKEQEGAIGFGMGRYRDLLHKQIKSKDKQ